MMKLLVYTDGRPQSADALAAGAELCSKLDAELAVITVRPGTPAGEMPPPVGHPVAWEDRADLPLGLKRLTDAVMHLSGGNLIASPPAEITIQDIAKGYMFVCTTADGRRLPFYEYFGNLIEVLNREVDEHHYDLLVIAPPRRSRLGRLVVGDTVRKLTLDLNTSMLVVRSGRLTDRFLVCSDGSPAARRQFALLHPLLPAIASPLELIYAHPNEADDTVLESARACLEQARTWLADCRPDVRITIREGRNPAGLISEAAGDNCVIMVGASLRHDVYRRMLGSFPMQLIERTKASVLLVKSPADPDVDFLKAPFTCDGK